MDFLLIGGGILLLYIGGEALVHGSVGLSLRNGLSPLIVGLTVMAFGTSAPELIVSVSSALSGYGNIAFGNVIGSNIANVLLILGLPALLAPIVTKGCNASASWVEMMVATLFFWAIAFFFAPFGLLHGLALLFVFAVVLFLQFKRARDGESPLPPELEKEVKNEPQWKIWAAIIAGLVLLPIGAQSLVTGAVSIAQEFGVSEAVIGLTIVAVGTSLPELAASISAARRGETSMMLGNVIGSNLFNILLILGATGLVAKTTIEPSLLRFDMLVLTATSILLGYFVLRGATISRAIGLALLAAYALYVYTLLP